MKKKTTIRICLISLLVGVQREFTPPPTSRNGTTTPGQHQNGTTTPGLHQNGRTTPAQPSKMDLGERKALWESLVCFYPSKFLLNLFFSFTFLVYYVSFWSRFDLWRRVRVVRMERMLWCLNALAVARDSQTYRQSWRCSVSRCIVIVFELIQHMVLMAGQPRVSSSTRSIVCCVLGESDEQGQQNQVNHPQVVFNSIPVGEVPCQSIPKHLLREHSTNPFL